MRRIALVVAALGCCAATGASSPVTELAGRYSQHLRNGDVDGRSYWSDDVLEIVPVDDRHAYFKVLLNFYNGHICSLDGVAGAEGDTLVYRSPERNEDTGRKCVLSIRHKGTVLLLDDGDNSCKDYCGTHGSFGGETLPWKSRRPITYIAKLKRSSNYRDAMTEWRTGKPMN